MTARSPATTCHQEVLNPSGTSTKERGRGGDLATPSISRSESRLSTKGVIEGVLGCTEKPSDADP